MKPTIPSILLFVFSLIISINASAQLITEANRCYSDKNYGCAVPKYIEVLKTKVYQEKDLATIQYRVGYGYAKMDMDKEAIPYLKAALKTKPDFGAATWELASAYFNVDSFSRSEEYYGKSIPFYKDDTSSLKRIYYWKGYALYRDRLYSDAIKDFLQAYQIDSTTDYIITALGDVSYELKNYIDAKKYYAKSIASAEKGKMNNDALATRYFWYGQALFNLKEYTESKQAFDKARGFGYEQRRIDWALGGSTFNMKLYRESIDYYSKAIRDYGGDSSSLKSLHYWRGRGYEELKDYSKAQADYATSIRFGPNYQPPYLGNADLLRNLKKYNEAIAAYDNTIKKFWSAAYADLAKMHYGRGRCYLALKDTVRAKSDFLFATEYEYSHTSANMELGRIAYAKKNYSNARIHFAYLNKTLDLDSATYSDVYFLKGMANREGGSTSYYTTAKTAFQESLNFNPRNAAARRYLADVYFIESRFDLAETEITKCIDLYSKNKDSLINMYRYRMQARNQQKKYKEALEDYDELNKLKPLTEPGDVKHMGQLAYEIQNFEKAVGIFTKLASMYKETQKDDLLFAYYARGLSNYQLKKKANAVADLEKALEYGPNSNDVKTWLEKAKALP